MKPPVAALGLALVAAALVPGAGRAENNASIGRIKVEAGAAFFEAECRRCHSPTASDPSYGPPLEGIVGRGAGTSAGYAYSEALGGSGIVWTPAALRAWMEDNTGLMPGTKMRHVGIEDRTVQDFILAYLSSISAK